jgi:hypothetical protein
MLSDSINRLGNWNPQLLRECRGRLKPRSVIATVGISLIVQFLMVLVFSQAAYKTVAWWPNLWNALTWTLPYVLFAGCAYYLVSDLVQEQQRGTLNFIRLSPRPAREILLGKILGAPILTYLSVAAAIPLHLFASWAVGIPLPLILSYYLLLVVGCTFLLSAALLVGLNSSQSLTLGQQSPSALVFTALAVFTWTPLFMTWNAQTVWRWFKEINQNTWNRPADIVWGYLGINDNFWIAHAFTLLNLGIGTYLIWRMLERRFRNPHTTVMSKRQSYALVAYLEVLFLGFFLRSEPMLDISASVVSLYIFNFVLFLTLIFALCPQRQMLLDWARYQLPLGGVGRDLMWGENSPAILAIAINLAIANAIVVPWLILYGAGQTQPLWLGPLMLTNLMLIFAVFVQQIFAAKVRNPVIWALGSLALWLIVPPILLGTLGLTPDRVPAAMALWTFLGNPFFDGTKPVIIRSALAGVLLQWIVIGFLVWQLTQRLQRLRNLG